MKNVFILIFMAAFKSCTPEVVKDRSIRVVELGKGKYTGRLINDSPNTDSGKFESRRGTYEGGWKDGRFHGEGTFQRKKSKEKYVGQYKMGLMHGRGIYTYYDGRVYEGQIENNEWRGQGTMTYKDGSKYIGEWYNSKRHGEGRLISADNTVTEGTWLKDEMKTKTSSYTLDPNDNTQDSNPVPSSSGSSKIKECWRKIEITDDDGEPRELEKLELNDDYYEHIICEYQEQTHHHRVFVGAMEERKRYGFGVEIKWRSNNDEIRSFEIKGGTWDGDTVVSDDVQISKNKDSKNSKLMYKTSVKVEDNNGVSKDVGVKVDENLKTVKCQKKTGGSFTERKCHKINRGKDEKIEDMKYVGDIKSSKQGSKKDGFGILTDLGDRTSEVKEYSGFFEDDSKHLFGRLENHNGHIYVGQMSWDRKTGVGLQATKPEGRRSHTDPKSHMTALFAKWLDGQANTAGVFLYPDDSMYIGFFMKGRFERGGGLWVDKKGRVRGKPKIEDNEN